MHPRGRGGEANAARFQLGMGLLDVFAVEEDVRVRELVRHLAPRFVREPSAQDEHDGTIPRLDLDPTLVAVRLVAHELESDHVRPELLRPFLVVDGDDDLADTCDHDDVLLRSCGCYAASSSGRPKRWKSSGLRNAVT